MMPCISKSSKSCLDANSRSSSFYLMVITCILGSFLSSAVAFTTPVMPTNHNSSAGSCASVKDFFIAHGISEKDVPERPLKDSLRYCDVPSAGSCCTAQIETKTAQFAKQVMEKNTRDAIQKMSSTLSTRAQKFHDLLRQLLHNSKDMFHNMFKQTYGLLYEQNSYVFSELFVKLEGYLLRGRLDLTEMLDQFFNQLYKKMFTVINGNYHFDEAYLTCVSKYMKELKPFGDVPDKLSGQVKRSFIATRVFKEALSSAADVAKAMTNLRPLNECTAQLTKMTTCGACMGHTEKPCEQYCVNLMKSCLQQYIELDVEWDAFVAQIEKVADRLLVPFNIVMVIEPINIKISEAIMNFQDDGVNISKRVYNGCGQPKLKGGRQQRSYPIAHPSSNSDFFIEDDEDSQPRTKRAADPTNPENSRRNSQEIKIEPYKFAQRENYQGTRNRGGNSRNSNTRNSQPYSNANGNKDDKEPGLDKLIKEIRQKVKDTKKFWSNLPYMACNSEELPTTSNSDNCWNGQSVNRYIAKPSDPAATMNVKQNQMVASQVKILKKAVENLKNAYNGKETEDWYAPVDEEDNSFDSGSGDDDREDDDDDSGSGDGHEPSIEEETKHEHFPSRPIEPIHTSNTDKPDRSDTIHPETVPPPTPDSASSLKEWRAKRLIITYFLPIVMAWFGGSLSAAVSDLL